MITTVGFVAGNMTHISMGLQLVAIGSFAIHYHRNRTSDFGRKLPFPTSI